MPDQSKHKTAKGVSAVLVGTAIVLGGVAITVQQYERDVDAAHSRQFAEETQQRFEHYKECVNHYAKIQHESQTVRSDAGAQYQQAVQSLLDANSALWRLVTHSLSTGQQVDHSTALNVLGRYQAAASHERKVLHQLQVERATHPYPVPPAKACE